MKRKAALIQPYFGTLPNYFRLALESYARNSDCDWYIFTDDRKHYDYPPNVVVTHTTLDRLKCMFQQKFDFPIALGRPYKLCDYRPMYGHLFADQLKDYDYWGHFDPDIIFGDIKKFLPDAASQPYDKFCSKGHFSLYRNTPAVNLLYQLKAANCLYYKDVIASERSWGFDERDNGVNAFFAVKGLRIYTACPIADIYFRDYAMRLIDGAVGEREKSRQSCFAYEHGAMYRYYLLGAEIHREEFMYIHLMQRRMKIYSGNTSEYLIYGNAFRERVPVTRELLETANRNRTFYRFWERWKYVIYARNLKPAFRLLFVNRNLRRFAVRLLEKSRFMPGGRRKASSR